MRSEGRTILTTSSKLKNYLTEQKEIPFLDIAREGERGDTKRQRGSFLNIPWELGQDKVTVPHPDLPQNHQENEP